MRLSTKVHKLLVLVATCAVMLSLTGGVAAAATNILPPGGYQVTSR